MAYSLAFRPDGEVLAVGGYNITSLWNSRTLDKLTMFTRRLGGGLELWIRCVDFSPDGNILAIGGGDNVANLWDLSDLTAPQKIGKLRHNGDADFLRFYSRWTTVGFWRLGTIYSESTTWRHRKLFIGRIPCGLLKQVC